MTKLMLPFVPRTHPWYGRYFTLTDWHANATPQCRQFDYTGWVLFVSALVTVLILRGR